MSDIEPDAPEKHRPSATGELPRILVFRDATEKARWLDAAASLDAATPELQAIADRFRRAAPNLRELAHEIHRFVRDRIRYQRDPMGREEFADSLTILKTGIDDCDGKSRLFVALIRAVGDRQLRARILPVWNSAREFVHVQAEVHWPGSEREPHAERDGWMRAELIVEGIELGEDPERGRDAYGHVRLAGGSR